MQSWEGKFGVTFLKDNLVISNLKIHISSDLEILSPNINSTDMFTLYVQVIN